MNIGIFTYGTRGDVQPYIALALGLMDKGHKVTIAAPANFKKMVEGFGIIFHPLYGDVEQGMNAAEGRDLLKSANTIKLIKFFFGILNDIKIPLRESYINGVDKVDHIVANAATIPIISAIAEKQNKKFAITYFMPPLVPTVEFPVSDFDFLNFAWYNKMTYKVVHLLFWKFLKNEVNEFRQELGLPVLKKNLLGHIDNQKPLDLYCFSPSLIPQPKDWEANHKITGFLTVPETQESSAENTNPPGLDVWLKNGTKPVYIGFGSNGVGSTEKLIDMVKAILDKTNHRVLLCAGWSQFENLPQHKNLFVAKYVNHHTTLPKCAVGIFHGGAGTLAAMLRNNLPVIIISFYTDQPAWGKIVERMKLGVHIPVKKLNVSKILLALKKVQTPEVLKQVDAIGARIRSENGLDNAIHEIESFFEQA